jgi:hypothetical protein
MKLAIVHQLPLEYYPPVTNFIDYSAAFDNVSVKAFSSHNQRNRLPYVSSNADLWRPNTNFCCKNRILKAIDRTFWHIKVAFKLNSFRPDAVLYFEPHSALAPYLYFRWLRGRAKLYIHHHEYYSPEDYLKSNNKSIRIARKLESKYLFPRAKWISQTNLKRLELFFRDNPSLDAEKLHVLANFPPKKWCVGENSAWKNDPISSPLKLVYVGSVSRTDTHIESLVQWVGGRNPNDVTLDIFAYQVDRSTADFLRNLRQSNIRFHSNGIAYHDIPKTLREYHVGLILYKGNTVNFQHNATNKLFEYLACGLDVWYADGLQGVDPYQTRDSYPRVIPLKFDKLSLNKHQSLRSRSNLVHQPWIGSSEEEFSKLMQAIVN